MKTFKMLHTKKKILKRKTTPQGGMFKTLLPFPSDGRQI